jgi:hypothetical protein
MTLDPLRMSQPPDHLIFRNKYTSSSIAKPHFSLG